MKRAAIITITALAAVLTSACSPDLHANSARRATPLDRMWAALADGDDGGSSTSASDAMTGVLSNALRSDSAPSQGRSYKPH